MFFFLFLFTIHILINEALSHLLAHPPYIWRPYTIGASSNGYVSLRWFYSFISVKLVFSHRLFSFTNSFPRCGERETDSHEIVTLSPTDGEKTDTLSMKYGDKKIDAFRSITSLNESLFPPPSLVKPTTFLLLSIVRLIGWMRETGSCEERQKKK